MIPVATSFRTGLAVGLGLLGLCMSPAGARPWTPDSESRLDRSAVAAILAEFSGDRKRALDEYLGLLREDPSLVFAADALRELVLETGSREALRVLGPWTLGHRGEDTRILGMWLDDLILARNFERFDEAVGTLADDAFPDLRLRRQLADGELQRAWNALETLPDWQALADEEWLELVEWRHAEDKAFKDPARALCLAWLADVDRRGRRDVFDRALAAIPAREGQELRLRQDLANGNLDAAREKLETLLERPGAGPDVYASLLQWVRLGSFKADSLALAGRVDQALAMLDHGHDGGGSSASSLARARLHWLAGRSGAALEALERSLELDSLQVDALVLRGHIHLERQDWPAAQAAFEAAERQFPGHPDILDPLCYSLQRQGQGARALPIRAALVENFPGQQSFWIDYANLLLELEHRDKALEVALAAVEVFAEQARPMLLNNTAYLMAQTGRDLERAEAIAVQALEGDVGSPYYLDTLGWIQLLRGDLDRAGHNLRRALEIRPDDTEILEHIGELLKREGDTAGARRAWERVLELQPGHPDLRQRLDALPAR